MSVKKLTCENCHKTFVLADGFNRVNELKPYVSAGIMEGSFNSRFCCRACADQWKNANPGKSEYTQGDELATGCLLAPFKIAWWFVKIGWRMTKWCGRVACKIMFNKWVVSILTFGFAWAAWKILDKIYGDN